MPMLESGPNEIFEGAAAEMDGKYLTFWMDGQLYGIPIAEVSQIIGVPPIAQLPDMPPCVKGVFSLRGEMIPVVDGRLRFGLEEVPCTERTCVIVTALRDRRAGLLVDEVCEVSGIEAERVTPPPDFSAGSRGDSCLSGLVGTENGAIILLDVSKVLSQEALGSFAAGGA